LYNRILILPLLMLALGLGGCGGTSQATPVGSSTGTGGTGTDGGTDPDTNNTSDETNVAPVANAGRDQYALAGSTVQLPGSGLDSDGTVVSYEWSQLDGSAATINNITAATTTVTLPAVLASETLVFELTVTDNDGAIDSDTVNITLYVEDEAVTNVRPVANAGADKLVTAGDVVTLVGSGSDYDGVVLSYQWQQVTGTSVILNNPGNASVTFTAPDVVQQETLIFALLVTDEQGATGADSMGVTVYPHMSAPDNLSVTVAESGFTLTWDAVDGADSYNLYYAVESFGSPVEVANYAALVGGTLVSDIADTTYKVTAPDTITTFYFAVTAVRDADESDGSDEINATSMMAISVAATGLLNDTGLDTCSNETTGGSACPVTGFEGQDGDYGRDAAARAGTLSKAGGGVAGFEFIKVNNDGDSLDPITDDWDCVFDVRTGLMWEAKQAAGNHARANTYSWYSTDSSLNGGRAGTSTGVGSCTPDIECNTSAYIDFVNSSKLCGITTWRLPTLMELTSIVNYGAEAPSVDVDYFANTLYDKSYWTSDTYAIEAFKAWAVSFNAGTTIFESKSVARHVRLVAGEKE
jgi:hypothetical protein